MTAFTIVELTGHIIDSLTLAKVIDKIQANGARYQINDLQIGEKKNDFSTAQISLWLHNEEDLEALLKELGEYGAYPITGDDAQLVACETSGQAPGGAYIRHVPPMEVCFSGRCIPVRRNGDDMVIVVSADKSEAHMARVAELKAGELVLAGDHGLKILPTLQGDPAHVSA